LNVIPIWVSPLRERKTDIPLLVEHFIAEFCRENNKEPKTISPEAIELLASYSWPGNVRELRSDLERAVVLSQKDKIELRDLSAPVREKTPSPASAPAAQSHLVARGFTLVELLLVLIGGVFVAEALSVVIQVFSFKFFGTRVFRIAPLHHHFERVGWSETKIVARFFIVSVLLAVFSVAALRIH
jgi:hypothetical protein